MVRSTLMFSALLWLAAVVPAFAQGETLFGPVAITPYTITVPGSYILTSNLTGAPNGLPVIVIAIPGPAAPGQHVDLDLNGFVLNNTPNPGAPVIAFAGPAPREVVVRHGTLIGGSVGFLALGGARKVVLEDVQVGNTATHGIHIRNAENFVIRRCVVSYAGVAGAPPGGIGILVDYPTAVVSWHGTIEENLVKAATQNGIVVDAHPMAKGVAILKKNQLNEIMTVGMPPPGWPYLGGISLLNLEPCHVSENTIRGVTGGGGLYIVAAEGCEFIDNVISDTFSHGIFLDPLSEDSLLLHNVVRGSFADAIRIAGTRNSIEANIMNATAPGSAGFGLHFMAGSALNRFGRNSATGNAGAACLFPGSVEFCDDNGPGGTNFSFTDNLMPGPVPF